MRPALKVLPCARQTAPDQVLPAPQQLLLQLHVMGFLCRPHYNDQWPSCVTPGSGPPTCDPSTEIPLDLRKLDIWCVCVVDCVSLACGEVPRCLFSLSSSPRDFQLRPELISAGSWVQMGLFARLPPLAVWEEFVLIAIGGMRSICADGLVASVVPCLCVIRCCCCFLLVWSRMDVSHTLIHT